jgi:hypothetical protein
VRGGNFPSEWGTFVQKHWQCTFCTNVPHYCRVWGRVFSCIYDGKIVLQKEEVESGDFYTIEEIMILKDIKSFTPDGLYVLSRYVDERADQFMEKE